MNSSQERRAALSAERAAELHAAIARKAEEDAAKAIVPGDHPNPLVSRFGGGMAPRKCETPGCECMTTGVEFEPRIPTPYIDAADAVMAYFSRFCETCILTIKTAEEEEAKNKANAAAAGVRLKWWKNIAWGGPESKYHDTKRDKLPDPEASEKVLRWTLNHPKGLMLLGDTGAGKTRTVYLLLLRILLENGVRPVIKKCAKLRHELARAATSDDKDARAKLMKSMIDAKILFLDDIGQMSASDSLGEALFDVVEERTQLGRPIIATSQIGGSDLTEKLTNDDNQAVALIRRLAESCYKVTFTRTTPLPKMEEIPLLIP